MKPKQAAMVFQKSGASQTAKRDTAAANLASYGVPAAQRDVEALNNFL